MDAGCGGFGASNGLYDFPVGWTAGLESSWSNGLYDVVARGGEAGAAAVEVAGAGVLAREIGRVPSPNLVKVSTVLSMLPPRPRRTVALRRSSGNPISLSVANFPSSDETSVSPICEGSEGGGEPCLVDRGDEGLLRENRRRLEVEEAERRPIPKNLPVFGGNGGGEPSGDLL